MSRNDLSKLAIHTITTKSWDIETAIRKYTEAGIHNITIWRQYLEDKDLKKIKNTIDEQNMRIVSLCRGGFFTHPEKEDREKAIHDNERAINQAAELNTPLVVLVCGAHPGQSLNTSRDQIKEGIERILPLAEDRNVNLGIEPLHPMYADSRSAINTLKQANDVCQEIKSKYLGVVIDVYHLWWDPQLEDEIRRCGEMENIFAFHISDWITPTTDLLNDRGLMGEGCIPIRQIKTWVEEAGFSSAHEVEIFSARYWQMDQDKFLDLIIKSYQDYCL
jgi:sugar phosphate isomerase/epimerase